MSERETWISLSQVGPAVPEAGGDNGPCPLDLALPSLAVEAAISFTGAHQGGLCPPLCARILLRDTALPGNASVVQETSESEGRLSCRASVLIFVLC